MEKLYASGAARLEIYDTQSGELVQEVDCSTDNSWLRVDLPKTYPTPIGVCPICNELDHEVPQGYDGYIGRTNTSPCAKCCEALKHYVEEYWKKQS